MGIDRNGDDSRHTPFALAAIGRGAISRPDRRHRSVPFAETIVFIVLVAIETAAAITAAAALSPLPWQFL